MRWPTWNEIKGGAATLLGWYVSTYLVALQQGIVDIHSPGGKYMTLATAVLNLYGIHGALNYQRGRQPWTNEQKIAESLRRMAANLPPLSGYEFLLVDPTATSASAVTPAAKPVVVGSASTPQKEGPK